MDSGEWDSYSVGEKVDLGNDGENELIICGPYGGIYLDARDNGVYAFAAGDGEACTLSYIYYDNGGIWIMYSNRMNAGYEAYMHKAAGGSVLWIAHAGAFPVHFPVPFPVPAYAAIFCQDCFSRPAIPGRSLSFSGTRCKGRFSLW